MKKLLSFSLILCLFGCFSPQSKIEEANENASHKIEVVKWRAVEGIDIEAFNTDLEPGKLTVDLGVYFPSNLDTAFKKVTLDRLMYSIEAAKEIYAPTGVQINLLWVKTGDIDSRYLSIQANKTPGIPKTEYANTYQHMQRHPAELTSETEMAFRTFIEPNPDNHRTIYLTVLQEVFYPFLDVSEGRNWMIKSVRTGGLSFPPYSYTTSIPKDLRGIITITNLERPDRLRSTVAHEIGHKVINVSHEYKDINPENEVFAEGGLMVYGDGEEIPSGAEGRWHLERLLLSPFLYTLQADGSKKWNPEFKEGGHYYDPIYVEKVVNFAGTSPIKGDW
ncbi:hypothetical protein EV198_0552 [Roseivirga ehrenbergii]|uniref:Uncharacterized protein n=1 Tax=Roseivirga ehrenbergii (strain DSM 102268 / JCM 13514 / KCTC 12282 / NCIMB 14502 / KMM 6017) TaxID=279360 RepID=A0A150X880_ROSEK|nr:hypothetical protein [Roseivirga ehrenbergii]KYG74935.1 hypothetical protein MB14_06960 [Roseivirga ehrenbergii]TCL13722.1 hypothetical protein EV198_0552 [Roseivirga ehrenbergii]